MKVETPLSVDYERDKIYLKKWMASNSQKALGMFAAKIFREGIFIGYNSGTLVCTDLCRPKHTTMTNGE